MIGAGTRLGLLMGDLAFIVYGSLLPFDAIEPSLGTAVARFSNLPWPNLDAGSRADWLGNSPLCPLLGFLVSGLLDSCRQSASGRLTAALAATAFGMVVALAVWVRQVCWRASFRCHSFFARVISLQRQLRLFVG